MVILPEIDLAMFSKAAPQERGHTHLYLRACEKQSRFDFSLSG
jgi:hypothetical protein